MLSPWPRARRIAWARSATWSLAKTLEARLRIVLGTSCSRWAMAALLKALGDQPQDFWAVQASGWRVADRYQRRAVGWRGRQSAQAARARREGSAWRTRLP